MYPGERIHRDDEKRTRCTRVGAGSCTPSTLFDAGTPTTPGPGHFTFPPSQVVATAVELCAAAPRSDVPARSRSIAVSGGGPVRFARRCATAPWRWRWLEGTSRRPVRVLRCLAIKDKVNDECRQQAIVADQVRQEAVDQVRFDGDLRHVAMVLTSIVTDNATWKKRAVSPSD